MSHHGPPRPLKDVWHGPERDEAQAARPHGGWPYTPPAEPQAAHGGGGMPQPYPPQYAQDPQYSFAPSPHASAAFPLPSPPHAGYGEYQMERGPPPAPPPPYMHEDAYAQVQPYYPPSQPAGLESDMLARGRDERQPPRLVHYGPASYAGLSAGAASDINSMYYPSRVPTSETGVATSSSSIYMQNQHGATAAFYTRTTQHQQLPPRAHTPPPPPPPHSPQRPIPTYMRYPPPYGHSHAPPQPPPQYYQHPQQQAPLPTQGRPLMMPDPQEQQHRVVAHAQAVTTTQSHAQMHPHMAMNAMGMPPVPPELQPMVYPVSRKQQMADQAAARKNKAAAAMAGAGGRSSSSRAGAGSASSGGSRSRGTSVASTPLMQPSSAQPAVAAVDDPIGLDPEVSAPASSTGAPVAGQRSAAPGSGKAGSDAANKKRRTCDICNKTFCGNSALIRHNRTHTGVKPYTCDECGRAFTQKNTLTVHRRRHTGERPYRCRACSTAFRQKSAWLRHERKCRTTVQAVPVMASAAATADRAVVVSSLPDNFPEISPTGNAWSTPLGHESWFPLPSPMGAGLTDGMPPPAPLSWPSPRRPNHQFGLGPPPPPPPPPAMPPSDFFDAMHNDMPMHRGAHSVQPPPTQQQQQQLLQQQYMHSDRRPRGPSDLTPASRHAPQ